MEIARVQQGLQQLLERLSLPQHIFARDTKEAREKAQACIVEMLSNESFPEEFAFRTKTLTTMSIIAPKRCKAELARYLQVSPQDRMKWSSYPKKIPGETIERALHGRFEELHYRYASAFVHLPSAPKKILWIARALQAAADRKCVRSKEVKRLAVKGSPEKVPALTQEILAEQKSFRDEIVYRFLQGFPGRIGV